MQRERKSGSRSSCITVILILFHPHRFEALGEGQGVAVVASRRCPITASGRIPRGFCPFDRTSITHLRLSIRFAYMLYD